MRTINLGDRPIDVAELLAQAEREDLIVRSPAGREFLIVAVQDFDHEVALARGNEKLMDFLERRARDDEAIALEDVRRRLGLDD